MNNDTCQNHSSDRVLLVDDQQDAVDTLALLLELQGHRVETARDGRSALEIARRFRPRLVLLDLGLPDMDGLGVARQLRREHGPGLTLVALTGHSRDEDIAAAHEAGCDYHLAKPVDLDHLRQVLCGATPPRAH